MVSCQTQTMVSQRDIATGLTRLMNPPETKFNPIKRPLDDVVVHGAFELTEVQLDSVARILTAGTRQSPKSRIIHNETYFSIGDEVNQVHLDIIRRNSKGLPRGRRRFQVFLEQEWFPRKARRTSEQPETLQRIEAALQELEHLGMTSTLTGHTSWIYQEGQATPKVTFPLPMFGIGGELTFVRGVRLSNEDDSRTAVMDWIDVGEGRRLSITVRLNFSGVVGIGTIQGVVEQSREIIAQLVNPQGRE